MHYDPRKSNLYTQQKPKDHVWEWIPELSGQGRWNIMLYQAKLIDMSAFTRESRLITSVHIAGNGYNSLSG